MFDSKAKLSESMSVQVQSWKTTLCECSQKDHL